MSINLETLEDIIRGASQHALAGTLTDTARVQLYKLALTIAAEEFHRVEKEANGNAVVKPDILILLQQISLICEPDVATDMLMMAMGQIAEAIGEVDAKEESNVG